MTGRAILFATLGVAAAVGSVRAQEPPDTLDHPAVDSVVVAPRVPVAALPVSTDSIEPISPRGAFIRSLAVPGWGQSAFGSYFRGGVYFSGWAANWYMNFRNAVRLDDARDRLALRRNEIRRALIFSPPDGEIYTPELLDAAVRSDTTANNLRKLVRSREQQQEDWIAWTIFWILASGVDGYVTAHLSDFPATIDVDPAADGSVSVRLEVPLGSTGRRRP